MHMERINEIRILRDKRVERVEQKKQLDKIVYQVIDEMSAEELSRYNAKLNYDILELLRTIDNKLK